AALAWIVMPGLGQKWLVALSSLPCIIMLLSYDLIPESPGYLCMKGRMSEAQTVLEKVAALNKTKLPPGILISDQSEDSNEEIPLSEDIYLLTRGPEKIEDSETSSSST
ncbi:hypothetical protein U1Q18_026916, partial [Sarracenia purpurea var. burkii]